MKTELTFVIDALTPETLSLTRLVAYLGELGTLLGDHPAIHFARVEHGSAALVVWLEPTARAAVDDRLARVNRGDGPPEAARALDALNRLLREDKAVAILRVDGADVIPLPGRMAPATERIGPIQQPTTVDGQLIRIGGRDRTVPFHLADGERLWKGDATRTLARDMGQHLFGPTLRVSGTGTWDRAGTGQWTLCRFHASSFEVLDDAPLADTLERLRATGPAHDDAPQRSRALRGDDDAE